MIDSFEIRPGYQISRIIKGGWQLSHGHNSGNSKDPVSDMFSFVEKGINTFDCADIYTGVEELIGKFIQENRRLSSPFEVKIHTKYVPDYSQLGSLRKEDVEDIIDRSLSRLSLEKLDMVQFHWWNYQVPGFLEAVYWLKEMQLKGKIDRLSTTNFNSEISRELLDSGMEITTAQVQYSLLDRRPEKELVELSKGSNTWLLCYGVLAGGFISEYWHGKDEPVHFDNRSLIKYKLIIDEIGGWDLFQNLLDCLSKIASKHKCSISSIAIRYMLDQPRVAAAIVGARNANHVDTYNSIFQMSLDEGDLNAISSIKAQMKEVPGDVFDIERDKEGKHGSIMKYNLNESK